jgi:hypothetical protein
MTDRRLDTMTDQALLVLHSKICDELWRRELSRSGNNPVADLGEVVASRALGVTRVRQSTAGYDAKDAAGLRYEIKARRQTARSTPGQLSAIRDLEGQHFDRLVVLLFAEDYSVARACVVPFEAVKRLARFRKHVNASIVYLRDLWAAPDIEDITEKCREVWPSRGAVERDEADEARAR